MQKNICFINNYNNEAYIRACLQSVFSQTHPFDEVILLDDGSTDSSIKIISEFSAIYQNLKLHQKNNAGQFSSFNEVLFLIPDNSQIFLLDGDDIYPSDYLELVLSQIGSDQWDFAFCEQQQFSNSSSSVKSALISQSSPYFFDSTSALTRSRECWIGNPTSCLSLSSALYKKIFPYPYSQDQSFWADNLIIYAASILGAKKVHLSGLGIGWRTHEANDSKKRYTTEDVAIRERAISRAFAWYCTKYNISRYPGILEFFSEYKKLGPVWQRRLDLPNKYRMLNRLIRSSVKQLLRNNT
jgi:glycosyltransferase involved in cell wall biosynthesis